MKYQEGLETFREATRYMFEAPSLYDVLFFLIGLFLALFFLIVLPYLWSKYRAKMSLKKEFILLGESSDLTGSEISLLWQCVNIIKEPNKILQSKAVFEKCASKLIKEDISKADTITQIRRKLKFETLPWFLPLTSTRDIELYQTGFITFDDKVYSSAVWDKNELELHLAFLDRPAKVPRTGDKVKFSFLREDDCRYYFQGKVLKVYEDGVKLVLVLPHTEELSKIQLRESLRWKVKIPAELSLFAEEGEYTVDTLIEDISPKGIKVCFSGHMKVEIGERVIVRFELNRLPIRAIGAVRNVSSKMGRSCLGINFDNLDSKIEDHIRKFIIEEQREVLKAYKLGEPKEGFSS
ncbi:MAG: flagellar brake protein [Aquificaceae bacterium]